MVMPRLGNHKSKTQCVCASAPTGSTQSIPVSPYPCQCTWPGAACQFDENTSPSPQRVFSNPSLQCCFPHPSLTEPSSVKRRIFTSSSPLFFFSILVFIFGNDWRKTSATRVLAEFSPTHPTLPALLRPEVGCPGKRNGRGRTMADLHKLASNGYYGQS